MNRSPFFVLEFLLLNTLLLIIFSCLSIFLSWSWLSPSYWPSSLELLRIALSTLGYIFPFIPIEESRYFYDSIIIYEWQTVFFLHLSVPFLLSLIFSFCITKASLKNRGNSKELDYISGPELRSGKEAIAHANKQQKRELKSAHAKLGIKVHPEIPVSIAREQNNFCILGTTGAGKSTILKPIIQQVIDRKDHAIIYDEKGEYTQSFYQKSNTILLAPWDARSAMWDIGKDIHSEEDAELLAQCLIPYSDKEKEKIWPDGARLILTGMIVSLMHEHKNKWEWNDLYELLKLSNEQILLRIKPCYPTINSLIQKDSKTTQGFFVHLITNLNWLKHLGLAWKRTNKKSFSLQQWIKDGNKKHVIIIQASSEYEAVGKPLCNAVISFMTKHYLSPSNDVRRPTWLFIDEFANLPPNPSIKKWLELSREYGGRSVICTQSLSQIRGIYGENETDALLNLLSNVITLRLGTAGNDAAYTSNMLSEQTAEVPDYQNKDHIGIRSKQKLVEASDLTQLKQANKQGVEGYLFIPGWQSVYKLTWPLFKKPAQAKKFIPAKWMLRKEVEKNPTPSNPKNKNTLNKWS